MLELVEPTVLRLPYPKCRIVSSLRGRKEASQITLPGTRRRPGDAKGVHFTSTLSLAFAENGASFRVGCGPYLKKQVSVFGILRLKL